MPIYLPITKITLTGSTNLVSLIGVTQPDVPREGMLAIIKATANVTPYVPFEGAPVISGGVTSIGQQQYIAVGDYVFDVFREITVGSNVYAALEEGTEIQSSEYLDKYQDILEDLLANIFSSCCPAITVVGSVVIWYDTYADLPVTGQDDVIYGTRDYYNLYTWYGGTYHAVAKDVYTYPTEADFPPIGEEEKIYIDAYVETAFFWDGIYYVEIGGGGIEDGDKGDITVSGAGTVWTIDNNVVTFAKFQQISTNTLLGRDTVGTGNVEEITLDSTLAFGGPVLGVVDDTNTQRVFAATDGTGVGPRRELNFVSALGFRLSTVDDAGNNRINITPAFGFYTVTGNNIIDTIALSATSYWSPIGAAATDNATETLRSVAWAALELPFKIASFTSSVASSCFAVVAISFNSSHPSDKIS